MQGVVCAVYWHLQEMDPYLLSDCLDASYFVFPMLFYIYRLHSDCFTLICANVHMFKPSYVFPLLSSQDKVNLFVWSPLNPWHSKALVGCSVPYFRATV